MQHEQNVEMENSHSFCIDREEEDTERFNQHKKFAEQGDAGEQNLVADAYFHGRGVAQDYSEAFFWYQKAAAQGDFYAKAGLANCYLEGNGVKKDPIQAVNLFKQVASQVISDIPTNNIQLRFLFDTQKSIQSTAQYQLGNCYYKGNGVKQDYDQAFEWFQKAAKRNEEAKVMLAECYLNGSGVEKNLVQGFKLLEEVVKKQNDALAQFELAIRYLFCKELEENRSQAIKWFEKAADPDQRTLRPECKQARIQAQTMLGICYYHEHSVKDNNSAFEYFEKSSKEGNDSIGYLWLACIYQLKNKQQFEKLNIYEQPWWHSSHSDSPHVKYHQQDIDKLLCKAAAGFFLKDDGYNYTDPDIIDFIFPENFVIEFLENQNFSYAKVILAFYYQCKNEKEKSLALLNEAASQNDILTYYLLGMHYKGTDFDKAKEYFDKVEKYKEQSTYEKDTVTILRISSQNEIISYQKEKLEEKNKHLTYAQERLRELVKNTSHLAGNLLRPNTQEKIAKKLKNSEFSEESKKLYYASSDIKYVKQQFKLLEIMQSLTGSEAITSQIKLDQVDKSNNQSMSIEDILNLAAFRAIDKLFDTNEYSLDFARETIEKKQGDFFKLSNKYQKYVLATNDDNYRLSIISWCSENLRPITINYKCADWKKILFYNNSQSVALFFCYFFELFFNAFKYADHNEHDFLTITLANEFIDNNEFLTMTWTNPKGNQTSFGSNQGLNLSASYISLLNDDNYKDKSQELIAHSDNTFELITRIDRKIFNLK
jgi:TPR repeat protein